MITHSLKSSLKKTLSFLLVLVFISTPVLSVALSADANSGNIFLGEESTTLDNTQIISQMGFNMSQTAAETAELNNSNNPFGPGIVSLNKVPELLVSSSSFTDGWKSTSKMYNYNNNELFSELTAGMKSAIYGGNESITNSELGGVVHMKDVALDPTGSGKDNYIARLFAASDGIQTSMRLRLINAETGAQIGNDFSLCTLGFVFYAHQSEAYLAMDSGDYDGDGQDELAVYIPIFSGKPRVVIYEINVRPSPQIADWICQYDLVDLAGLSYFHDMNTPKYENSYLRYPAVDITTISNTHSDDLVITVSPGRNLHQNGAPSWSDGPYHLYTRVLVALNPMLNDASDYHAVKDVARFNMCWSHADFYSTADSKFETMMFGGVSGGDINGDGYEDIIIAGYRISESSNSNTSGNSNSHLDKDRYLVTYMLYQPNSSTYAAPVIAQWVDCKTDRNGYSYDLNDELHCNNNSIDNMLSPLAVAAFAERGFDYADSIFISGIVARLETDAKPYRFCDSIPSSLTTVSFDNTGLLVKNAYKLPLMDIHEHGRINRWISSPVVGDFSDNPFGVEQLAFVYSFKTTAGSSYKTMDYVVTVNQCIMEPQSVKIYASKSDVLENHEIRYMEWNGNAGYNSISLCTPDVDDDSTLIRFTGGKEYYFSNPTVFAVLQAAPYFSDLAIADPSYSSVGSTSLTYTAGSGTSHSEGGNIHLGLKIGFEEKVAAKVVVGYKHTINISGHIGYGYNHSSETIFGTGFTASPLDDLVVAIVTPYIKYNYEMFVPSENRWVETTISLPQPGRITHIPVTLYDKVASQSGGSIDPIRGNVLYSTPGDPLTYNVPYAKPDNWLGTEIALGNGTASAVDTGIGGGNSISQTINISSSTTHSINWGAGVGYETDYNLFEVFTSESLGLEYSGSYGWVSLSGQTYTGTVASIPEEYADMGYSFTWQFGSWKSTINNDEECLVLGYVVDDVRSPPSAPQNLYVSNVTENAVTLKWTPGTIPSETYGIYRLTSEGWWHCGEVAYGTNTFTDTNCSPDQSYTYAVRGFKNSTGDSSVFSAPATGKTYPSDNAPGITAQPTDKSVYAGQDVAFEVSVIPEQGGSEIQYEWQQYANLNWNAIPYSIGGGVNSSLLTFHNVTEDLNGTLLRCQISQMIDTRVITIYSDSVILNVSRTDSKASLTSNTEIGPANMIYTNLIELGTNDVQVPVTAILNNAHLTIHKSNDNYYLGQGNILKYVINDSGINKIHSDPDAEVELSNEDVSDLLISTYFVSDDNADIKINCSILGETPFYSETDPQIIVSGISYSPYSGADMILCNYYEKYVDDESNEIYVVREYDEDRHLFSLEKYYLLDGAKYLPLKMITLDSDGKPITFEDLLIHDIELEIPQYEYAEEILEGTEHELVVEIETESDKVPTGIVIFSIRYLATNTSAEFAVELDDYGIARYAWLPTGVGQYEVTSYYNGDAYYSPSVSNTVSYYAHGLGKELMITSATRMTFGESLDLEAGLYTAGIEHNEDISATFSIINGLDGSDVFISGSSFTPDSAGDYLVSASYTAEDITYYAATTITVNPALLTVKAPDQSCYIGDIDTYEFQLEFEGVINGDQLDNYFAAVCDHRSSLGTHQINIRYAYTNPALDNYIVTTVPGTLTIMDSQGDQTSGDKDYTLYYAAAVITILIAIGMAYLFIKKK